MNIKKSIYRSLQKPIVFRFQLAKTICILDTISPTLQSGTKQIVSA